MSLFHQALRNTGATLLFLWVLLLAPFALRSEDTDAAYGYFRVVEGGSSTLIQAATGEREEIEQHRPILVGDQVWVAPSGRLEIILPSFDLLRLDGGTELAFESLVGSPDADDDETTFRLFEGEMQLVLFDDPQAARRPVSVKARGTTVFFHDAGTYLIGLGPSDELWVVVRDGYAEVATIRGSSVVRAGDEARVTLASYSSTRIVNAGGLDSLESWGEDLWRQGEGARYASRNENEADDDYDPRLRYAAAPLDDYGDWLEVEGRRAWRPYRSDGWRPYFEGRWVSTPGGLSWVSFEPWGWVPYHYGGWDRVDGFGWVWFPGRRFSVAHVHWYWGQDYTAWFPSAYYDRYYGRRFGWQRDFRFAGWGGGSWDSYGDWVFCPTVYLGRQRQNRYSHTGRSVQEYTGWRELPRGIITTDTRRLTPDTWRDPQKVEEVLRGKLRPDDRGSVNRELPDLSAYVARQPRGSSEELLRTVRRGAVEKAVQRETPKRSSEPKARTSANGSLAQKQPAARGVDRREGNLQERRRLEAVATPRARATTPKETTKPARTSPRSGSTEALRPQATPRPSDEGKRRDENQRRLETRTRLESQTASGPRVGNTRVENRREARPIPKAPVRRSESVEQKATSVRRRPAPPPQKRSSEGSTTSNRRSSGTVSGSRTPSTRTPKARSRVAAPEKTKTAESKGAVSKSSGSKGSASATKPKQGQLAPKKRPTKERNQGI